jgi:phage shock protein A
MPLSTRTEFASRAIQAKLNVYQAKEQFESVLKVYNDRLDGLINLIGLMKRRILELEKDASLAKKESVSLAKNG